jgi:hypothetical protein
MGDMTPSMAEMVARQRSAEILDLPLGSPLPPSGELLAMALDYIDALTARAEKAEAERDALRASLYCGYCASARQQSPGQLDGCLKHFPWSPVEGGQ